MSSDNEKPCNEAKLQQRFERDIPELRAAIGDANRDGALSAVEVAKEITDNPEGPLAKLLYKQAMPALRKAQIDLGTVHVLAEQYRADPTVQPEELRQAVSEFEATVLARASDEMQQAIATPHVQATRRSQCTMQRDVDRYADQLLDPVFSTSPEGRNAVESDLNRGAMMLRAIKSIELGSAQVLYDTLATPADIEAVKSGVSQRVKELTKPDDVPAPRTIFTRGEPIN